MHFGLKTPPITDGMWIWTGFKPTMHRWLDPLQLGWYCWNVPNESTEFACILCYSGLCLFILCVCAPAGYEVNLNEDGVTQTPQTFNLKIPPLANLYSLNSAGSCCDPVEVASGRLVSAQQGRQLSETGREGGSGFCGLAPVSVKVGFPFRSMTESALRLRKDKHIMNLCVWFTIHWLCLRDFQPYFK